MRARDRVGCGAAGTRPRDGRAGGTRRQIETACGSAGTGPRRPVRLAVVAGSTALLKRLLVGRPYRTDQEHATVLPKRVAIPVLAADPLSSLAYAPGQILVSLSVAGAAAYAYAPWVAAAVVVVLLAVVAGYRQTVRAYPSGGGDYEVATANLGWRGGLVVASALLVDYLLTVAVSVAAVVDHLAALTAYAAEHRVGIALTVVVLLVALNLRGVRPFGAVFALPTYLFLGAMVALVGWGLWRLLVRGEQLRAESADLTVAATGGGLAGFALVVVLARALASGSVALTGVQTFAAQVPSFRPPRSRNAAAGLLGLGLISSALMIAIVVLARAADVRYVEVPERQIPGAGPEYVQPPVTAQLADAVFEAAPAAAYAVVAVTALVLVSAANTTFEWFPTLGAALALNRYLPRALHTRGDRLAFSNGVVLLGVGASVLLAAFRADVIGLIHLYIVGVFVAFTVSQAAMVRHWNRALAGERDPAAHRRMRRARLVNAVAAGLSAVVLTSVLVTKIDRGVWISLLLIVAAYLLMRSIRAHYDDVASQLAPPEQRPILPSRNHAVVLVNRVHMPTLRALAYARATRPDTLTAVAVNIDEAETRALVADWEGRGLDVPLIVVDSPYREITDPIVDYVRSVRRSSPRDVVTVFIPEYVVGRWWENLLHNQSTKRLRSRLRYLPGVMVTSVPWRLSSSADREGAGADRDITRPARATDVPDFERAPEI
jgi:amino acid transporter